jgi:hypothetical protein
MSFKQPPQIYDSQGKPRRVGLELEFAGVNIEEAAQLIKELYGGQIKEGSRYKVEILKTDLGDFRVELDARILQKMAEEDLFNKFGINLEEKSRKSVEDLVDRLAKTVVPIEVVMPPVEIERLDELEKLRAKLQENRAEGTKVSFMHAFGMHINIETPDLKVETLLRYLRAFFVIYPWLLEQLKIDITRRISPFVDHFPEQYVRKILDPSYNPQQREFVKDYLRYSSTRNRPLDMMPILGLLENELVEKALDGEKNEPRSAFHYRLPNSHIDDSDWLFEDEWNYWVVIEKLAYDLEMLNKLCKLYLHREREKMISFRKEWSKTIAILLDLDE